MTCLFYGAGPLTAWTPAQPLLAFFTFVIYGAGPLLVSMTCSFYGEVLLLVSVTCLFCDEGRLWFLSLVYSII
jgi:hypothetical protein